MGRRRDSLVFKIRSSAMPSALRSGSVGGLLRAPRQRRAQKAGNPSSASAPRQPPKLRRWSCMARSSALPGGVRCSLSPPAKAPSLTISRRRGLRRGPRTGQRWPDHEPPGGASTSGPPDPPPPGSSPPVPRRPCSAGSAAVRVRLVQPGRSSLRSAVFAGSRSFTRSAAVNGALSRPARPTLKLRQRHGFWLCPAQRLSGSRRII